MDSEQLNMAKKLKMKFVFCFVTFHFSLFTFNLFGQAPAPFDPCQKTDTNKIKEMLIGTWMQVTDTTHVLVISQDTLAETIIVEMDGAPRKNQSYWSYKFIDNFLSTDAVTCYSLREYKQDYANHTDIAINGITDHYLLMGASGKTVFKKK